MNRPRYRRRRSRGFTLTELLVMLVIVAVLALIIFQVSARTINRAKHAVDITRKRHIGSAVTARAVENNGRGYSKEEIGNSMYREWRDPLSLCQVLHDFLPGEESWLSPAANKRQRRYGNSYAWSVARNLTTMTISQIEKPQNTIVLWNNFGYTLPSVYGVPEGNTAGPRQAPRQYHYRPWNRGRSVNWYYLDGLPDESRRAIHARSHPALPAAHAGTRCREHASGMSAIATAEPANTHGRQNARLLRQAGSLSSTT